MLVYQIEISNGIDLYDKYLFVPVKVDDAQSIAFGEVHENEVCFSVSSIYVEVFLFHFLKKHFDPTLKYNSHRVTNWRNDTYQCVFDELGGYNFYTYDTIRKMIIDLEETARLLETDFDNPLVAPIISRYEVCYLHAPDSEAWEDGEFGEVKDHVSVVCDFYRRVAKSLLYAIENSSEYDLFNVEYGY